ncbi:thioredoxin-like protein [Aspergillus steynii IBT 23096]|uniref:Thioredoxin-like protein n=1 Tax=Aspergillus steynii IBT 23096 TaxID=1392250 RepID=A0A2I2G4C7_9EURO|nr:thioredoxin-like protein [Aspergillus steynii IBT 23096]PLB47713.1 thioredoxin-like protein [Aspergillus steynii IBT 23096]
MAIITIDIISDIVCMWCFIGKRRLDKAIHLHKKTYPGGSADKVVITWHPYYLQHNPSPHSVEKRVLADKNLAHMTPEERTGLMNRMDQIGRAVGIRLNHHGKIGSTRDAHRLILLSQIEDKKRDQSHSGELQDAMAEKLFQAYHEQAKDISDREVLREIGRDVLGLQAAEVDAWLNDEDNGRRVDYEAQRNREQVSSGVPVFLIQGKEHRVDGAQDIEDFMELFVKIREST